MPDLAGIASRLPRADATAFRLTAQKPASYLRSRQLLGPDIDPEVRELSGGPLAGATSQTNSQGTVGDDLQ